MMRALKNKRELVTTSFAFCKFFVDLPGRYPRRYGRSGKAYK